MKPSTPPSQPIIWPRADRAALAAFDPRTKQCTMNCGPHADDPRLDKERKLLCDDCDPVDLMKVPCRRCGIPAEERLGMVDNCPMRAPEQHCPNYNKENA